MLNQNELSIFDPNYDQLQSKWQVRLLFIRKIFINILRFVRYPLQNLIEKLDGTREIRYHHEHIEIIERRALKFAECGLDYKPKRELDETRSK